jgi:hypothetical protein
MDGDCIVIADQLWYMPVDREDNGRVLICELVRDVRDPPQLTRVTSENRGDRHR